MKKGKFRIWLGLFLILAQLLALGTVSSEGMKFWDTDWNAASTQTNATDDFDTLIFATYVGYHKLETALLEEFPESLGLIYNDDGSSGYQLSYIEAASRDIRHTLFDNGYHDFLDVYDFFIVIGFLLCGILGLILLILGLIARAKYNRTFSPEYYVDARVGIGVGFPFAGLALCIISFASAFAYFDFSLALLIYLFPILLMTIFFLFRYGREASTLPAGAMFAWGLVYLLTAFDTLAMIYLYPSAFTTGQEIYSISRLLLGLACCILYFFAATKLYKDGNKDEIKRLTLLSGTIAVFFCLLGPLIAEITDADEYFASVWWPELLFTVVMVFYVWFVFPQIPLYESSGALEEPCPHCGKPLPAGTERCFRCGKTVSAAIETPAPVPPRGRFCAKCGTRVEPGQVFCPHCGHKVG